LWKIDVVVSDAELQKRREKMDAKWKDAWRPNRDRTASPALRAYTAMTTSASKGALRDVSQVEKKRV
jgi:dihydroxy-acid dehydratase